MSSKYLLAIARDGFRAQYQSELSRSLIAVTKVKSKRRNVVRYIFRFDNLSSHNLRIRRIRITLHFVFILFAQNRASEIQTPFLHVVQSIRLEHRMGTFLLSFYTFCNFTTVRNLMLAGRDREFAQFDPASKCRHNKCNDDITQSTGVLNKVKAGVDL